MDQGWIRIWRTLRPMLRDHAGLPVWMWVLLNAEYEPKVVEWDGSRLTLAPGQIVTTTALIAADVSLERGKVYRQLKKLEAAERLTLKNLGSSTLITVLNWAHYQDQKNRTANRTDSEQPNEQPNEQPKYSFPTGSEDSRTAQRTAQRTKTEQQTELTEEEKKEGITSPPLRDASIQPMLPAPTLGTVLAFLAKNSPYSEKIGRLAFEAAEESKLDGSWRWGNGRRVPDWRVEILERCSRLEEVLEPEKSAPKKNGAALVADRIHLHQRLAALRAQAAKHPGNPEFGDTPTGMAHRAVYRSLVQEIDTLTKKIAAHE